MSRRFSDNELGALLGLVFIGGWIVLCLALVALKFWLVASLVTSAVKVASDDCGQTYGVEGVIKGNWFCPEK